MVNLIEINWPQWISAICSIAALIVSIITQFKSRKYYTEYALVGKDGAVLSHKGFKDYGLHIVCTSVPIDQDRIDQLIPEYKIEFSKTPDYFEVSTREGAVVRLKQESPLVFKLRFVGVGFGSPVIACNFKIQAY